MERFAQLLRPWTMPAIPDDIPHGDMPGDQIRIGAEHKSKANVLFPALAARLHPCLTESPAGRAVVTVCGGSGVGKSEIASLLSFCLNALGVGCYVLSGDNYPRRVPRDNDAERLRVYRTGGLRGLVASGLNTPARAEALRALWQSGQDADPRACEANPWLATYQREARAALSGYLGSEREIDFAELSEIVARFKQGADELWLKRMGRETTELWYERVFFRDTRVLIVEWTHGNSRRYSGVDIPILLNSTPEETLAHRRARHRDGGTDSPFTAVVLALEQKMLEDQADRAKIILSKAGDLMTYAEYRQVMAQSARGCEA